MEAVRAGAGVAVARKVHGGAGPPGEVAPDDVVAVALHDGRDGSAAGVVAVGAGVEHVAAAGEAVVTGVEEAADVLGAEDGREVRREGGDGVRAVGPVEPVEQRPAVDQEVGGGGAGRGGEVEAGVRGRHASSISPRRGPFHG